MVLLTLVSLPGTGLAEMITVSPFMTSTAGFSCAAMRDRADSGSPWLPVHKHRNPVGRQQVDVLRPHQQTVGHVQVAQVRGDVDVLDHAPPDDGHRPSVSRGRVHDLLDAMDVARERGDDDAALAPERRCCPDR